ncbi:hypothetical protein PIB30_061190 [Stylosanthes scabra]|uniref:Uncharacterized protein n=1 Tax=Stylosanthes scabra TaxID=79078 RepID=A0ABU6TKI2_9FABA|nr:hypothetical protein [Stylosanthes scabra]
MATLAEENPVHVDISSEEGEAISAERLNRLRETNNGRFASLQKQIDDIKELCTVQNAKHNEAIALIWSLAENQNTSLGLGSNNRANQGSRLGKTPPSVTQVPSEPQQLRTFTRRKTMRSNTRSIGARKRSSGKTSGRGKRSLNDTFNRFTGGGNGNRSFVTSSTQRTLRWAAEHNFIHMRKVDNTHWGEDIGGTIPQVIEFH